MLKRLSPNAYATLVVAIVLIGIATLLGIATLIVRTAPAPVVDSPVETIETEPELTTRDHVQRLRASDSTADNIGADLIEEFVRDADGDGKLDYTLERDSSGLVIIFND